MNKDMLQLQNDEFWAAEEFAAEVRRHSLTAVVDDDYPQVRSAYEHALKKLLEAVKANREPVKAYREEHLNVEAPLDIYSHDDILRICSNIEERGGSFARHLGRALLHADSENRRRIIATWPEMLRKYSSL